MLNGPQREAVKLSAQEARIVEQLRKWRVDFPDYASKCLKVVDKQAKLSQLILNDAQLILHAKIEAQRMEHGMVRAIVLKGRKQGASTYIGARFYSKTRLWKYRRAKVMAHDQDSTDVLFKMVKTYYDNDPFALGADQSSAKVLGFTNNSSYTVATAGGSGEAGRGDSPTLAHLSEMAFYKNPEKIFAGFANSVPIETGTEIFIESTANGVGNDFHTRWNRAEGGLEADGDIVTYIPVFLPWFIQREYRLPVSGPLTLNTEPEAEGLPSESDLFDMYGLDYEQIAWRRFQIRDTFNNSVETFMQEYPNTPAEAFQTPGLDLFIKPIYVARARRRTGIKAYGPKILGVDPAGLGGDMFMTTFRQGNVVHWHKGRKAIEPGEEQGMYVASLYDEEGGFDAINVDYSGGWGTSSVAWLRENRPDIYAKINLVDFGSKSQAKTVNPHKPGPRNRRAEMYLRAREWIQSPEGVMIPDENQLEGDLGAITTRITGQSTDTILESKKDIKTRLKRSPDTADSWVLTFAVPDRTVQTSLTPSRPSANDTFAGKPVETPAAPAVSPYQDPFFDGGPNFDSGGGWML